MEELRSEFVKLGIKALSIETTPATWEEGYDDHTREMTRRPKTFDLVLVFQFFDDPKRKIQRVKVDAQEGREHFIGTKDFNVKLIELYKPKIEELRQQRKAVAA